MQGLEVKQKVIYASKGSLEDMKYSKELIQTLSEPSQQCYQI